MFSTTRTMLKLTTIVVALAANACGVHGVRPVESATAKLSCAGGTIASAADAALYGACERVNGDLRISSAELNDLSALSALRSVSGKLEISGNSQLGDLSGLGNLQSAGKVVISGNPELDSLSGLEGLTQVAELVIQNNGIFQTTGLSNLTDVGNLVVEDNAKLNSLRGLRSLAHARSVRIMNNPRLCARGMLPALARVDQQLVVSHNRGLSSPDVSQLLGRVERGFGPGVDTVASLEPLR